MNNHGFFENDSITNALHRRITQPLTQLSKIKAGRSYGLAYGKERLLAEGFMLLARATDRQVQSPGRHLYLQMFHCAIPSDTPSNCPTVTGTRTLTVDEINSAVRNIA